MIGDSDAVDGKGLCSQAGPGDRCRENGDGEAYRQEGPASAALYIMRNTLVHGRDRQKHDLTWIQCGADDPPSLIE